VAKHEKKYNRFVPCDKEIKVFVHLSLLPQLLSMENYFLATGQCKMQTVDYCFHRANENVTTIVPLFSNPENNSPQSVHGLHFTLHLLATIVFSLECIACSLTHPKAEWL